MKRTSELLCTKYVATIMLLFGLSGTFAAENVPAKAPKVFPADVRVEHEVEFANGPCTVGTGSSGQQPEQMISWRVVSRWRFRCRPYGAGSFRGAVAIQMPLLRS
jgi:hypothetical protein